MRALDNRTAAYSSSSLSRFRQRVKEVLVTELEVSETTAGEVVRLAARALGSVGAASFDDVTAMLERLGIRNSWNRVLKCSRSAALAEWIEPHVRGTLLDLLCGDGEVGEALAGRGVNITLTERVADYVSDRTLHRLPFVTFERCRSSFAQYDSILLSTVLHHERWPDDLLAFACRRARKRLLIVENCIVGEDGAEFHLLMDLFFNLCLNRTPIPSPGSHASPSEWLAKTGNFGRLVVVDQRDSIPGVPLPHHLIVVERENLNGEA